MPDGFQSIEDLLPDGEGGEGDDSTVQQVLQTKQQEIKLKDLERLTEEQAKSAGLPYINLSGFAISPEALSKIPEEESRRLQAVCFLYTGEELRVGAVAITQDVKALMELLMQKLHCRGGLYLISRHSFETAVRLYTTLPKPKEIIRGVKITEEELSQYTEAFSTFQDLQAKIGEADVTQIVTMMLAAAIKSRASDIHVEGEEKDIKVRYRIDGVLHDVAVMDKELWQKIISRMKVLAKVKINVSDRPQDGRFSIFHYTGHIDIRASFLPTSFGESIVLRLLDSAQEQISFEKLGIIGPSYEELKRQVERPNGMVITTGPTGSGKTTTLYAILLKLKNQETKIITVEDPIEYQIEGINQSQVTENFTFAKGLRSIVRQDPDVIMVGEIRDLETAEIAIQAALTGHLVLSTIHTNDASGTIPRLLSMGVKAYLLAPAINAMIGQRLVRRICEHCKEEYTLDNEQQRRVDEIVAGMNERAKQLLGEGPLHFYRGKGCEVCQGLGYKGRIGIYEIVIMNAEIEQSIQQNKVSEFELEAIAVKNGMIKMVQDGIIKATQGVTTVEEVLRVAE